jgi:NTP pyrophosphatase (non-canonical NTP hydrolase)
MMEDEPHTDPPGDYNPIRPEYRKPPLSRGLMQSIPMDWSKFRRMTLEEIVAQCIQDSKDWFPEEWDDLFVASAYVAGEAGELINEAKKIRRGKVDASKMQEEAIDVLIHLCCIFGILETNVTEEYRVKREFNRQRFGRGPEGS